MFMAAGLCRLMRPVVVVGIARRADIPDVFKVVKVGNRPCVSPGESLTVLYGAPTRPAALAEANEPFARHPLILRPPAALNCRHLYEKSATVKARGPEELNSIVHPFP